MPPNLIYSYREEENLPLVFANTEVKIFMRMDASNRIYKARYLCRDLDLSQLFEHFFSRIHDEKIDKLMILLEEEARKLESSFSCFLLDKALFYFKQGLDHINGVVRVNMYDGAKIICRCAKVDKAYLEQVFHQKKGMRKDIFQETQACSFCGTCRNDFEECFNALQLGHSYIDGYLPEEWLEKVRNDLQGFYDYTSLDIFSEELIVQAASRDQFEIHYCGAKNLDRNKLINALENFYSGKLGRSISISLKALS